MYEFVDSGCFIDGCCYVFGEVYGMVGGEFDVFDVVGVYYV